MAMVMAIVMAALVGSGCSSTGRSSSPPSTAPPVATSSLSTTASPGTGTGGSTGPDRGRIVLLAERDNGRRVAVGVGERVRVVLRSTYWQFADPSDPTVAQALGASVVVLASPPGARCVPGGGCGTATAVYRVVGAGSAVVSAHRTSCGEALRCGPGQSDWQVTLVAGP